MASMAAAAEKENISENHSEGESEKSNNISNGGISKKKKYWQRCSGMKIK